MATRCRVGALRSLGQIAPEVPNSRRRHQALALGLVDGFFVRGAFGAIAAFLLRRSVQVSG